MNTNKNELLISRVFKNLLQRFTQPAGFYPIKFYTKYNKIRRSGHLYAVK